ncbi:polysaccharide lyase [Streptomyces sp. NPDC047014]|uniref:polysaccharide lyase n=1 Tax=Streptomyces sp. NPDC047014 TaxID=3155736 RepID=UPI0033F9C9F3
MLQTHSRRRRVGTVSAAVLVVSLTPFEAAADRLNPVPFRDGFESGTTSAFPRKGIDGTGTVTVAPAPGARGGKAVRFAMPDDGNSYRTEIATNRLPYGSYRYTFANYLPAEWISYENQTIVSQWHGGTGTIPAVVLAVRSDRWMMLVHWKTGSGQVDEVKYDLGPARLGRWNQWSFDITWSTATTTGSITAGLDGRQVGSHRGPNSYHQDTAPYHKIGLYRPNWQAWKGHKAGGGSAVVNYYDDITITPLSGASAAQPAPPSPQPTTPPTTSPSPSATPALSATGPATRAPSPGSSDVIPLDAADTDTDNNALQSADSPTPDRTTIALALGSALLAAALTLTLRHRTRAARRRTNSHRA